MKKIFALFILILAMCTNAFAVDAFTLPTFDLTQFYALGTLLLAAGAGVFIFKKVRKLMGF